MPVEIRGHPEGHHKVVDTAVRNAPALLSPADVTALLRLPPPASDPRDLHMAAMPDGATDEHGTQVRDAAVLVPMVARDGAVNLLFTQRTEHLAAQDRKSTRLNSSHVSESRMPSSA